MTTEMTHDAWNEMIIKNHYDRMVGYEVSDQVSFNHKNRDILLSMYPQLALGFFPFLQKIIKKIMLLFGKVRTEASIGLSMMVMNIFIYHMVIYLYYMIYLNMMMSGTM